MSSTFLGFYRDVNNERVQVYRSILDGSYTVVEEDGTQILMGFSLPKSYTKENIEAGGDY